MGLYTNRIQAPTKTRTADWIPEDGELFRDSSGNLYMGDNVTASTDLDPIGGVASPAGATCGLPFIYDNSAPADFGNAGAIRMNSTTAASVTTITLGQLDLNNEDQEGYLDLFTSGLMKIYHGSGLCIVFKVTRMVNKLSTDNYFEFTVEHVSGTMPTHLETVRMDAVMDAPGVRRLVVEYDVDNVSGATVFNSYAADASFSVVGNVIVVTITGGFTNNNQEYTYGFGTLIGVDTTTPGPIAVQYVDVDTAHVHLGSFADPKYAKFTIITQQ